MEVTGDFGKRTLGGTVEERGWLEQVHKEEARWRQKILRHLSKGMVPAGKVGPREGGADCFVKM